MTRSSPQLTEQQSTWLQDELHETILCLTEKEQELKQLYEVVSGLRLRVSMLKTLITAEPQAVSSNGTTKTELDRAVTSNQRNQNHRSPMDMIHPEYKGMKLSDIAIAVLKRHTEPLTTAELTKLIYNTATKEEFTRARNSLASELRSGLKSSPPKWRKVGQYAYTALSSSPTNEKRV